MAEKNNATCSICGKEYYACLACRDSVQLAPWKIHTDTSEHYKVFQIVRGYSTGVYNKEEAKEKFKNIDLSDLNTFRPHIKSLIKDILKEEKQVVKSVEKAEEANETKNTIVKKEKQVVENTTVSRKKNYKVETE